MGTPSLIASSNIPGPESSSPADIVGPPPMTLGLAQVGGSDLPIAGGKAANLGELIGAGFPIPPGFVVSTAAYDLVATTDTIASLMPEVLASGDGEAIRQAFARATVPPAVEDAIQQAYRAMGSGPVAVRSSATAEDLPDAAFAGQQDSFLGIIDEPGLLQAVRRCWGSLWSDRAIAYREKHGFAHASVKLAVVVQRLVPAEAAGVMFTANPITGARDETVIDASTGLGEAIVGGLVTPDHIILRRGRLGWRIVERQQGRHEVAIRALPGGGTEQIAGGTSGPVLPDAVLRRLARMGAAIQAHFGRPQDVEWAWADETIYVLQSRPITALPAEPPRRGRFAMPRGGPTEYLQIRPYPLDMTSWLPTVSRALQQMLPVGNLFPAIDTLWVVEDGVVTRLGEMPEIRPTPALLLVPLRMISLAWQHDPARWREDPALAETLARLQALDRLDPHAMSWRSLLAVAHDAMQIPSLAVQLRRRYFPRTLLALGALRLLLGLLGETARFGELLSGVDNKTLETNRELENLAAAIRADPSLADRFQSADPAALWDALALDPAGRRFLESVDRFLMNYGHRETGSPLLISLPTWRDQPEIVLGILKGLALAPPPRRDAAPAWESVREQILAHPALQAAPLRSLFVSLLDNARRFMDLREDTHFLMTAPMTQMRRIFLEMGRRLTEIGVLDVADDVFHLQFDELERLAGVWPPPAALATTLRDAVHARAERREALADTPLIPLPQPSPPALPGDAMVAGTSGSPGIAEGPVRIVPGPDAFGTLQPGDVLVAPYTNPSWTPLFGRAAAVIVDAGSAMSHAAIVAREYGIPAVMGTGDAVQRLEDGQRVTVDGTRGLVFPTAEQGAANAE